ncbi:META domain-containing protein [Neisseria weaveri]|uniref:META domain n=1 Tax=Neisseria weaveri TaxID=28091 RepID=A0A3S5F9N3_9NEIS|nr:META domain-containing protein [Neisseria weaveri]VEJ50569.1 META domain [Neisseria weaveri]
MKTALLLPLSLCACVIPVALPLPLTNPQPMQIYGQWQLTEVNRKQVDYADAVMTILSTDRQFNIRTNCNHVFGQYQNDSAAKKLSFQGLSSTLKACPDMRLEQQLSQTLPKVGSYRFNGKFIEMTDNENRVILQARRINDQAPKLK